MVLRVVSVPPVTARHPGMFRHLILFWISNLSEDFQEFLPFHHRICNWPVHYRIYHDLSLCGRRLSFLLFIQKQILACFSSGRAVPISFLPLSLLYYYLGIFGLPSQQRGSGGTSYAAAPFLAKSFAVSLLSTPTCRDTHWRVTFLFSPRSLSLFRHSHTIFELILWKLKTLIPAWRFDKRLNRAQLSIA